MSGQIEIPFAIGEQVWWTGHANREEWVECPECAGTKALTLILGNGEEHSLACRCCSSGYEEPRGMVKRIIHEREPTPFTPRRVDIIGDEIRYSESGPDATCWTSAYASDLFADRAECANRCAVMNEEGRVAQEEMLLNNLKSARKDLAWSVHYWGRQVGRMKRDLERAESRLKASKERKRSND